MATQIIQTGATVRVIANPRGIDSVGVVDGYLVVSYSDGTSDNVGYIGSGVGTPEPPNLFNTAGIASLAGYQVVGFVDAANSIDARLEALGY